MGDQAWMGSATVGAVLGALAGISGIAIAGVGSFAVAGPVIATLGSAAIGAAAGALVGQKLPEPDEDDLNGE
jgi:hypothetical protein